MVSLPFLSPINKNIQHTRQARRLFFDRVGSFSAETDQIGLVRTFSLLICVLIHIIDVTQNTVRCYVARCLKVAVGTALGAKQVLRRV